MADIAAGFALVRGTLMPVPMFLGLLLASSLMYIAGMVLNDVYDFEQDKKERPERPLPSGRIPRQWATLLGWQFLFVGVLLAWLVGFLVQGSEAAAIPWRSGAVATILAACIVAYDAIMKRTPAGPIFMGACRFFNLLLGMSIADQVDMNRLWALGFFNNELLIASGIGVYIAGVTWFARTEAKESSQLQLGLGLATMIAGLLMLAAYAMLPDVRPDHFTSLNKTTWQLLIVLLGFTVARRAAMAVYLPSPERVQTAVKQAILSLIVLDAAICLVAGQYGPYLAIGVLLLLAPMLLLGRWVYST